MEPFAIRNSLLASRLQAQVLRLGRGGAAGARLRLYLERRQRSERRLSSLSETQPCRAPAASLDLADPGPTTLADKVP